MSSQPPDASGPKDNIVRRVAEGVATNLITAAALWLIASLTGVVATNPALTAAASGVVAGAVVILAVAWILGDRKRLWFLRSAINWVNGSSLLGLIIAHLSGGRPQEFDRHYRIHTFGGCARWPVRRRGFLAVGNVLLLTPERAARTLPAQVRIQAGRHATQYAALGGILAIPMYALAAGISWLRCRDTTSANLFELAVDVPDGGYVRPQPFTRPPWYWAAWIGVVSVPGAAAGWLTWRVLQTLFAG